MIKITPNSTARTSAAFILHITHRNTLFPLKNPWQASQAGNEQSLKANIKMMLIFFLCLHAEYLLVYGCRLNSLPLSHLWISWRMQLTLRQTHKQQWAHIIRLFCFFIYSFMHVCSMHTRACVKLKFKLVRNNAGDCSASAEIYLLSVVNSR